MDGKWEGGVAVPQGVNPLMLSSEAGHGLEP